MPAVRATAALVVGSSADEACGGALRLLAVLAGVALLAAVEAARLGQRLRAARPLALVVEDLCIT